ncbi:MAG: DUF4168 domain-containing protein [Halofilum sp. (in: g-proteobacteria)]
MNATNPAAKTAFALALGVTTPAFASNGSELDRDAAASEAHALSADAVSNVQLERFLEAARRVESIRSKYADRVDSQGTEARELAQREMAEEIESQGLDVREYREIAELVANDSDLRARLNMVAVGSRTE